MNPQTYPLCPYNVFSKINYLTHLREYVTPRVLPRYERFEQNPCLSGSPLACFKYCPQGVDEHMNPTQLGASLHDPLIDETIYMKD
jgi:hypothetical protein